MTPPRLLDLLACPRCAAPLEPSDDMLRCRGCGSAFPVLDGIPRLAPGEVAAGQAETAERFGAQWRHFDELHPEFEEEFLGWVTPLARADFAGKLVLDAGCGFGRHTAIAATFGCRHIVGIDLSDAVDASGHTVGSLENADIVQGDLLHPPFRVLDGHGPFELVYTIGVLHHLPVPADGFASLARLVAPGGQLAVWVYGWEGNAVVRMLVEPLRRSMRRLRPAQVRLVALPFTLLLYALVHTVYRRASAERLPLGAYLRTLRAFTFRHVYSIVADQLVAPTTHYIRRAEVEDWFRSAGFENVVISRRNGNSWRGLGRKPLSAS